MSFPLHPISIGKIQTRNNVFLAPLAGYTNFAFRKLCKEYGAGFTYTEMVSAKGLFYGSENTKELLGEDGEKNVAVQLFGHDPEILRRACESEELSRFPVVDLNMGCPVPKIYKNGEGSALLENIPLAEKIVAECKKSGKEITVKFRIGVSPEKIVAEEFARRMEGAGASLLTVHGRTREKYYSGEVDFGEIEKVKSAVKIPVVGNGGVFSVDDAETLMGRTGVDGVMIARAALYDPQIFCDFLGKPRENVFSMLCKQAKWTTERCDERFCVVYLRKMAAFYTKGVRGAAAFKNRLFAATSVDEILSIAEEIFK